MFFCLRIKVQMPCAQHIIEFLFLPIRKTHSWSFFCLRPQNRPPPPASERSEAKIWCFPSEERKKFGIFGIFGRFLAFLADMYGSSPALVHRIFCGVKGKLNWLYSQSRTQASSLALSDQEMKSY